MAEPCHAVAPRRSKLDLVGLLLVAEDVLAAVLEVALFQSQALAPLLKRDAMVVVGVAALQER